jgi:serine O-acetyltransferase
MNAMKADVHRQFGRYSLSLLFHAAIMRRSFRSILTMRICQHVATSGHALRLFLPVLKLMHHLAAHIAGIDFSWRTSVGAGFAITHGWGLVVNPMVVIGNNVTLFHGVTLGQRDRIRPDGSRVTEYPMLEDEVWVGPHAIIIGGVTVGRGSRIAGGAYVTESVPPYSIVVGNPATIVKTGCVPDVMNLAET